MARLRDYYGPPDFEQKIIQAIRDGKAPGRYTVSDIIEDEDQGYGSKMSMEPQGMRPPKGVSPYGGYTLKPTTQITYS